MVCLEPESVGVLAAEGGKEGLDLKGAKERAAEESDGEEGTEQEETKGTE